MRRAAACVLASLAGLCAPLARASAGDLERADALWARRAEGQIEGRAVRSRASDAIAAYERARDGDPKRLEAHWKLLRALWFSGAFATHDRTAERRVYERALDAGERAFARLDTPVAAAERRDAAELYFWYAVNLGAWSRVAGVLEAVRAGVANRLHDATLQSLALDPDVEQGGAIRLLSRLHSELPRVPLFSGWVDARQAVPLAERALAEYPQHPGNRYLLGLALLDREPARRAEALALIERTASLEPRADHVVEDLAIRVDARGRLAGERRAG